MLGRKDRRKRHGVSIDEVIRRGEKNRQYDLICPAPLAQAMGIEKGEVIDWVVEDQYTLRIERVEAREAKQPRKKG
jgi:hypothetical protein